MIKYWKLQRIIELNLKNTSYPTMLSKWFIYFQNNTKLHKGLPIKKQNKQKYIAYQTMSTYII